MKKNRVLTNLIDLLKGKKGELRSEIAVRQTKVLELNEELYQKKKQLAEVEKRLTELHHERRFKVTDHAVVQYLQRARGLDVDAIRSLILNKEVQAKLRKSDTGKFPHPDGFKVIAEKGTVVTIIL